MDSAEIEVRKLLKARATFVRSSGHEVYRLDNGRKVAIRRPKKKGHQDHWKSCLSYLKRMLALSKE